MYVCIYYTTYRVLYRTLYMKSSYKRQELVQTKISKLKVQILKCTIAKLVSSLLCSVVTTQCHVLYLYTVVYVVNVKNFHWLHHFPLNASTSTCNTSIMLTLE